MFRHFVPPICTQGIIQHLMDKTSSTIRHFVAATLLALLPVLSAAQTDKDTIDVLKSIALPLLDIETENNVNPTFTPIEAPEGCWGLGITDNDYVAGRLQITLLDSTLYDSGDYVKDKSGLRIKVRGNTSAVYFEQTPYKLKLSKKADLLLRDDKTQKNKNWALLSTQLTGNLFFTLAGLEAARIVGMPWEPEVRFVNVVLNGRYIGLYNLIETIERADSRIQIDDSGFVVENDAYWWNEGDAYFHTPHQVSGMGYTFKYPDYEDVDSQRVAQIKDIMETAEDALWNGGEVDSMFDYTSFAKWLIAHDLLGSTDAAGTNIYYVMEAIGSDGNALKPLQAGPLWDFGSIFKANGSDWSAQHTSEITYYPQLFKREKFASEYIRLFNALKSTFASDIAERLNNVNATYGEAIGQSIDIDNSDYSGIDRQINELIDKFAQRINTVDSLIKREYSTLDIEATTAQTSKRHTTTRLIDMAGRDFTGIDPQALPCGIYIEKMADGSVRKRIVTNKGRL